MFRHFVNRRITYRLMEKYTEAIADFDRAISLDGDNLQALVNRGITYRLMEESAEALDDLTAPLRLKEIMFRRLLPAEQLII